jgi:hypothetical protein
MWVEYMSDCQLRKKYSAGTLVTSTVVNEAHGSVVVKALRYKPEGRELEPR